MPTPLGHALGGIAAGCALAPASRAGSAAGALWRYAPWFALLGMFPDVDLLFDVHRGPTHSLGAALIAGLAALALTRRWRLAAAAACAYASHVLLDWLGADTSIPVGVMAFWPLTREHYQSSVEVFDSVWRRNETPDFWSHNIKALARELAVLLPLAWLSLSYSLRRRWLVRQRYE
jgi:inner membrane protein